MSLYLNKYPRKTFKNTEYKTDTKILNLSSKTHKPWPFFFSDWKRFMASEKTLKHAASTLYKKEERLGNGLSEAI